jgi:hypothetical protein
MKALRLFTEEKAVMLFVSLCWAVLLLLSLSVCTLFLTVPASRAQEAEVEDAAPAAYYRLATISLQEYGSRVAPIVSAAMVDDRISGEENRRISKLVEDLDRAEAKAQLRQELAKFKVQ